MKKLRFLIFMTYLLLLSWGILFKFMPPSHWYFGQPHVSINLIPYRDLARTWDGRLDVSEILLNILAFLPVGYFAYRPSYRVSKGVLWGLGLSLSYESLQLLLGIGMFDVTDLIHNGLGSLLGAGLAKVFDHRIKNNLRNFKFR